MSDGRADADADDDDDARDGDGGVRDLDANDRDANLLAREHAAAVETPRRWTVISDADAR